MSLTDPTILSNATDISAKYPHSSQRWRYYIGGNREFIRYGDSTGFSSSDNFTAITTSGGAVYTYETAQKFEHSVRYESEIGVSFKIEQSLDAGEKIVVGYGDPDLENNMASADGWFMEFESGIPNDECYIAVYENGTIITNGGSRKKVELTNPVTNWSRLSIQIFSGGPEYISLYENTPFEAKTSNRGFRKVGTASSNEDKIAEISTNKKITFSIRGSGASMEISGASFNVNSAESNSLSRTKQLGFFGVPVNTTGTYIPIAAARQEPSKSDIKGELLNMRITYFDSEADVEVVAKEFDPQNVTFGGSDSWKYEAGLTADETTVQFRNDVDQVVDNTGSSTGSTSNPGGNLVARSVDVVSSTGFGANQTLSQVTASANGSARNFFLSGDVGVVFCKTTATGNLSLEFTYQENW